jgi:phage terminase large subunit
MRQIVNRQYQPLFQPPQGVRYIILLGGRGAGRSTVVSQFLTAKLVAPEYLRAAIMRFVLGDIRNSCFREIFDRLEEQEITKHIDINQSSMTFSYGQNEILAHGFRKSSGDQSAKLKSLANYNVVWIEEADEVAEADFMQLDDSLRTIKGNITVILTLNPPPKNHWIIKRWFSLQPSEQPGFYVPECTHSDVLYIRTDYHDNAKNLDEHTKKRYEGYKETNPDHYWNMIRGYVPETLQGKIYKDWKRIDEVPHEARLVCYGLDFGFHPDPAAIVAIYQYNGGYVVDEILYQTDLDNEHLANVLHNKQKAPVICDSAEPKSIAELRKYGIDAHPCEKGADSVRAGIKHVQSLRISYTSMSHNIEKEYDNYAWKITKDGDEVGIEDPKCENHLMSAIRYGLSMSTRHTVDEKEVARVILQERQNIQNASQRYGVV